MDAQGPANCFQGNVPELINNGKITSASTSKYFEGSKTEEHAVNITPEILQMTSEKVSDKSTLCNILLACQQVHQLVEPAKVYTDAVFSKHPIQLKLDSFLKAIKGHQALLVHSLTFNAKDIQHHELKVINEILMKTTNLKPPSLEFVEICNTTGQHDECQAGTVIHPASQDLVEISARVPCPGKTTVYDESQTIDLETVPLNGGILIKTLSFSIDPYMRGRMRAATKKSYSEYVVQTDVAHVKLLENKENIPWSNYVGAAGMPGQKGLVLFTYVSIPSDDEVLTQGETVFVTTGAGSDEKVEFMKKIGVDIAFNYKTRTRYWDNVGGATLEAALDAANPYARFIECGMISQYNQTSPYGWRIQTLMNIVGKRLSLNGFIVSDHMTPENVKEFYDTIPAMIAKGELVFLEDKKYGLDKVGEAILDVQSGKNHGKSVIVVAEE
ncbi:NAD P-binding protein [Salix suchowensis]|nr:NAD P-binding protein [Salix suchowensis]